MGGSSTTDSHKVESNTINPQQMAQYQQNYAGAQGVANSLQPYTGPVTAGFNQNQLNAQGILSGIATDPSYAANGQTAINQTKGIFDAIPNGTITPQAITASTYDPAQLKGVDLSPYMNPFQSQVIDASVAQNQFARDQQGVNDNAAATAAHAFGGSRQGVQRAETTAGYDRNNQQNIAALNSQNFGQAQTAALSDINAQNTAGQFNAGQRQGADIFNSGQNVSAQQNSFSNTLAALGLKMNAAGQLEQLNQADLARAAQQGGILSAVGDAQQAQQQTAYGNDFNLAQSNNQLALTRQQLLNQALGLIPLEQTNTSDGTQTTKSNPGLGGVLGAVGGLGLAAATGGSSLGLTSGLGGLSGLFGGSLRGQSSGPSMGWT